MKPAVGAMSLHVWRTSRDTAIDHETRFADLVAERDVLVQRFAPEVVDGERSAVYLAGEFSHAWNSLPEADDITAFDGIEAGYEPSAPIREQAAAVLEAARDHLGLNRDAVPYARVDYVERDDGIVLLELELIEPFLGLNRDPDAVERCAEAIVAYFDGADTSARGGQTSP